MSSALDMSLEDLIKNNKKTGGGGGGGSRGGRGGGRGSSGPGPNRRFNNRGANRTTPYSLGKPIQAPETAWQHDMFTDPVALAAAATAAAFPGQVAGRGSAIETGTKLYISNLDYGVSNEDIKELFSEVGDLKRYSIHYDRSGRSKGTAEVVFSRRSDAAAAVKRYNNVQLDGKPMKIEIVGTNIVTPAVIPIATNGIFANPNGVPRGGQPRGRASTRLRGGGGGGGASVGGRGRGSGRGRGRGRGRSEPVSADDLDADLEKYHSEAMQIN
ncbi:hypothetical protein AQUCO_02700296v1 [Aquilegia coerulea]|uniref:RRM domain-containing protein n=1 Tax=Aquilegia coerulea TaxID=218851 RepID=A0A2G5D6A3_AQUCA|nr:hypothetical protein AQUCO_02700296v1 [Aquilegia coerulea]PIA39013.1 hypothetical protein AQUCO_02700296v1 [Aquilegia coerulea]